jgi:hypothetical protein
MVVSGSSVKSMVKVWPSVDEAPRRARKYGASLMRRSFMMCLAVEEYLSVTASLLGLRGQYSDSCFNERIQETYPNIQAD